MSLLTTLEASRKYKVSTRHLRYLLTNGLVSGRQAEISSVKSVWLLEESSLKDYLSKEHKPGRKPQNKKD